MKIIFDLSYKMIDVRFVFEDMFGEKGMNCLILRKRCI